MRPRAAPRPRVEELNGRGPRERRWPLVVLAAAAVVATSLVARWDSSTPAPAGGPSGTPPAQDERSPRDAGTLERRRQDDRGRWVPGAQAPLGKHDGAVTVWTGRELFVWGGRRVVETGGGAPAADGVMYDPRTDRWREVAAAPLEARVGAGAAWTGTEIVIWGGQGRFGFLADGAAYDPAADTWRPLSPGPLTPRAGAAVVWTGAEALVAGGADNAGPVYDTATLDLAADAWRPAGDLPSVLAVGDWEQGLHGMRDGGLIVLWAEGGAGAARGTPGAWEPLPTLEAGYGYLGITPSTRGLLALVGSPRTHGVRAELLVLATVAAAWQPTRDAPRIASPDGVVAAADGDLQYIVGGHGNSARFDAGGSRWRLLPRMGHLDGNALLAVLDDGLLLWPGGDGDRRPKLLLLPPDATSRRPPRGVPG